MTGREIEISLLDHGKEAYCTAPSELKLVTEPSKRLSLVITLSLTSEFNADNDGNDQFSTLPRIACHTSAFWNAFSQYRCKSSSAQRPLLVIEMDTNNDDIDN